MRFVSVRSSLRLLACAAALAFTRPLAAQEPRIIINSGDKMAFGSMLTVPISDDAIRSLISTHLPDELRQDDPRYVVLVLDANDQYVSGKGGKATVVTGGADGNVFVIGDSTGAGGPVIIRRTSSSTSSSSDSPPVNAVSAFSARIGGDGDGVFGSGYSMADISTIGVRKFAAGQLGTNTIVVSVVKLK